VPPSAQAERVEERQARNQPLEQHNTDLLSEVTASSLTPFGFCRRSSLVLDRQQSVLSRCWGGSAPARN